MTIQKAIVEFLDHLEAVKNASPHTLRNYGTDLQIFASFLLDQNLSFNEVDKHAIREFLAQQRENGISKRSTARRLSALKSFFRFWTNKGVFKESPTQNIAQPKLEKKIPAILTYGQVERLLSQPNTTTLLGLRDRAILELFYSSGLRVSELTGLNHADQQDLWLRVRGKGRKQRDVPLTPLADQHIDRYLAHSLYPNPLPENPLFLNKHGTRLSPRSVDRLFKKYLLLSGLAGSITPHTIRHTIATHWLENDMNIKFIQELLGHASPSTTTLYTQVSPSLRKKIHEALHPRS